MMPATSATGLFGWAGSGIAPPGAPCALGAASDHGNGISRGAGRAPAAIRAAAASLGATDVVGMDWGDLARRGDEEGTAYVERLAEAVMHVRRQGWCPLVLGGDHSLSYAAISALQRDEDLCLVWFDAHTDFSPWHGDPGHDHKQVLRRIATLPGVHRIVQVGYRGITIGDERYLGERAQVIPTHEARGLDDERFLAAIPSDLPCYVSVDIDVVDPIAAPGTAAPVPDGMSPALLRRMLAALVRERRLLGMDVMEVNPLLDRSGRTSVLAARLLHDVAQGWHRQFAMAAT